MRDVRTTRNRLIELLISRDQDIENGITKFQHSLQTATRAYKDNKREEYIVCALFHDVTGGICPDNHARSSAETLKNFISSENYWMLYNHDLIQKDHWEGKPHIKKHESWYKMTVEFCDKYDFPSFDPNYDSEDLGFFLPMIERVIK